MDEAPAAGTADRRTLGRWQRVFAASLVRDRPFTQGHGVDGPSADAQSLCDLSLR
jgi:hypothetical protein